MTASLTDLISQVEDDQSLTDPWDKASALVLMVPPTEHTEALTDLCALHLNLRAQRGTGNRFQPMVQSPADRVPSQPAPRPQRNYASEAKAVARKRHASPKVLAASIAWSDLLSSQVTIPGTTTRLAIADMTPPQLTSVADALYDTHEHLLSLAAACEAAGASTPRDLPEDAVKAALTPELEEAS